MAYEIERKFLVSSADYKALATSSHRITQAYIARTDKGVVRVRILDDDAFLTLKSRNEGMKRLEWEHRIPVEDAREIMERLTEGNIIDKTRYIVEHDGFRWEIDEFHGDLDGLVVAEIELPSEDTVFSIPTFIGREVTGERRFYNSVLASGAKHGPKT